jgi:hypothetical protein
MAIVQEVLSAGISFRRYNKGGIIPQRRLATRQTLSLRDTGSDGRALLVVSIIIFLILVQPTDPSSVHRSRLLVHSCHYR